MSLTDHKRAVLEILTDYRGEDQRITKKQLIASLQLRGHSLGESHSQQDRNLRLLMEELRQERTGAFICASLKGGYYLARNWAELHKATESDYNRALNLMARIRQQRKNAGLNVSTQPLPSLVDPDQEPSSPAPPKQAPPPEPVRKPTPPPADIQARMAAWRSKKNIKPGKSLNRSPQLKEPQP